MQKPQARFIAASITNNRTRTSYKNLLHKVLKNTTLGKNQIFTEEAIQLYQLSK